MHFSNFLLLLQFPPQMNLCANQIVRHHSLTQLNSSPKIYIPITRNTWLRQTAVAVRIKKPNFSRTVFTGLNPVAAEIQHLLSAKTVDLSRSFSVFIVLGICNFDSSSFVSSFLRSMLTVYSKPLKAFLNWLLMHYSLSTLKATSCMWN